MKYVFGNSASEDAHFYEALVDRPQLKYILTPHEGPGAAMAAGYVKASGTDGWQASNVFGREFQLVRKRNRRGAWHYTLLVR